MPSRPLRSGSHMSERSGWRIRSSARSRNMVSKMVMQVPIGRRAFIFSLFIYGGSTFIFEDTLFFPPIGLLIEDYFEHLAFTGIHVNYGQEINSWFYRGAPLIGDVTCLDSARFHLSHHLSA